MAEPKRSWYKVVINHGPGHQSQTVWYRYATRAQIDYQIEDSNLDWPIPTIRKIRKLPEDIQKRLIAAERYRIKAARFMIKILKDTPTSRVPKGKRSVCD